ncbi:MAG: phage baseplate assembly protein V, partial [Succinivibrio sp.]
MTSLLQKKELQSLQRSFCSDYTFRTSYYSFSLIIGLFLMISEQIRDFLTNLIRVGEITETLPSKHKVRVSFPDDGDVSHELPVICPNTQDNSDFHMPDVGEDVLCVFLPGGIEDGFVLGSFYAPEVERPTANQDERKVRFKDGTTVTYNRATHELDVVIEGTHIHADRQKVDITTPQTVNITTKNVNVIAS